MCAGMQISSPVKSLLCLGGLVGYLSSAQLNRICVCVCQSMSFSLDADTTLSLHKPLISHICRQADPVYLQLCVGHIQSFLFWNPPCFFLSVFFFSFFSFFFLLDVKLSQPYQIIYAHEKRSSRYGARSNWTRRSSENRSRVKTTSTILWLQNYCRAFTVSMQIQDNIIHACSHISPWIWSMRVRQVMVDIQKGMETTCLQRLLSQSLIVI